MSDQKNRVRLNAHRIAPLPAALALMASGSALAQAMPDTYETQADQSLTANVLDNDSSGLTVDGHTPPSHGTVTIAADGSFTYTPTGGFSGNDSFTYSAHDASNSPSNALVSIAVDPVVATDFLTTPAGTAVHTNVLTNDIGTGLTVTQVNQPSNGTLTITPSGALTYVPNSGFTGNDFGSYEVTDSSGNIGIGNAAVQILVTSATTPSVSSAPATTPVTLGLMATLLAWFGLRRRRRTN